MGKASKGNNNGFGAANNKTISTRFCHPLAAFLFFSACGVSGASLSSQVFIRSNYTKLTERKEKNTSSTTIFITLWESKLLLAVKIRKCHLRRVWLLDSFRFQSHVLISTLTLRWVARAKALSSFDSRFTPERRFWMTFFLRFLHLQVLSTWLRIFLSPCRVSEGKNFRCKAFSLRALNDLIIITPMPLLHLPLDVLTNFSFLASFQGPPQQTQPFKFTVTENCERIKEEFNFLQAQYHK